MVIFKLPHFQHQDRYAPLLAGVIYKGYITHVLPKQSYAACLYFIILAKTRGGELIDPIGYKKDFFFQVSLDTKISSGNLFIFFLLEEFYHYW